MNQTHFLEVSNLKKVYTGKKQDTIIEGITFTIPKGKTLGLVGQSGSGKTTIAKMIAGMETATEGTILLNGNVLTKKRTRDQKRLIQYIFQEPFSSLNPKWSIQKILSEPLTLYFHLSKTALEQRLDELLTEVGLPLEVKYALPKELSGGQCQRIGIARALAAEPELLICDEPTSALDVTIQKQIISLLQKIQKENQLTMLFIAHGLDIIYQLSDDVLVMKDGHMIEHTETETLFSAPKAAYTKELIAAIPQLQIPYYQ